MDSVHCVQPFPADAALWNGPERKKQKVGGIRTHISPPPPPQSSVWFPKGLVAFVYKQTRRDLSARPSSSVQAAAWARSRERATPGGGSFRLRTRGGQRGSVPGGLLSGSVVQLAPLSPLFSIFYMFFSFFTFSPFFGWPH